MRCRWIARGVFHHFILSKYSAHVIWSVLWCFYVLSLTVQVPFHYMGNYFKKFLHLCSSEEKGHRCLQWQEGETIPLYIFGVHHICIVILSFTHGRDTSHQIVIRLVTLTTSNCYKLKKNVIGFIIINITTQLMNNPNPQLQVYIHVKWCKLCSKSQLLDCLCHCLLNVHYIIAKVSIESWIN